MVYESLFRFRILPRFPGSLFARPGPFLLTSLGP